MGPVHSATVGQFPLSGKYISSTCIVLTLLTLIALVALLLQ